MDGGGRVTPGAVTDDSMDGGGRVTPGAVTDDSMDGIGRVEEAKAEITEGTEKNKQMLMIFIFSVFIVVQKSVSGVPDLSDKVLRTNI